MIYVVLIITRWHIKIYMFFRKIFNLNHSRPDRCPANIHGDWRLGTGDWGWEERVSPYGLSISIEPHVFPAHTGSFHRSR